MDHYQERAEEILEDIRIRRGGDISDQLVEFVEEDLGVIEHVALQLLDARSEARAQRERLLAFQRAVSQARRLDTDTVAVEVLVDLFHRFDFPKPPDENAT